MGLQAVTARLAPIRTAGRAAARPCLFSHLTILQDLQLIQFLIKLLEIVYNLHRSIMSTIEHSLLAKLSIEDEVKIKLPTPDPAQPTFLGVPREVRDRIYVSTFQTGEGRLVAQPEG